jgi:MFS family permease
MLQAAQVRVLATALILDVSGFVPIALVGAFAVQLTNDLGISESGIGLTVTCYFVAGAVAALLAGPEIDRFGWYRGVMAAASLCAVAVMAMALLVHSAWGMLIAISLVGIASAVNIPCTNVMLFRMLPIARLGVAISVKQASIPLSLLVAGLALPVIALSIGWRWAFAGAGLLPVLGLVLMPRKSGLHSERLPQRRAESRAAMRRLSRVFMSVCLAGILPGALLAYCVVSLVSAGVPNGTAGVIFAIASIAGLLGRLGAGWRGDLSGHTAYRDVSVLMAGGGLGALIMSTWQPMVMIGGCLLAFGMGWAWPSLVSLLVVKAESQNPGSSSSLVQSAGMLGSGVGPAVIGLVLPLVGLQISWVVVGGLTIVGALVVAVAGRTQEPPEGGLPGWEAT